MRLLSKSEALAYIESQARAIDASGCLTNPFATPEWLLHFIEHVVEPDWQLLFPEAAGAGTGWMPLYRDGANSLHARSLSNFYTSLHSPIIGAMGDIGGSAEMLVRDLAGVRPRIASLRLEPLDADGEDTLALCRALSSGGWFVRRFFRFGNLSLPCDGLDFERYMATRDSQLRNTVQRKTRKLLSAGGLEIVTDPADVESAMDDYEGIYARSWKRQEPYPHFARGWARICAERGWLRLGIARLNGEAVAAQLWFLYAGRAYIFKLVYDEAHARSSAGTVLTAHLMKHVLDVDRVREVDFLSGSDTYKMKWMNHSRDRIGLMACNLRSKEGLLLAAHEFAGQATARWRGQRRERWGRHASPAGSAPEGL